MRKRYTRYVVARGITLGQPRAWCGRWYLRAAWALPAQARQQARALSLVAQLTLAKRRRGA